MDGFSGVKETDGAKNTTRHHVHMARARHEAEVLYTRYPFIFHPSFFPFIATVLLGQRTMCGELGTSDCSWCVDRKGVLEPCHDSDGGSLLRNEL